MHCTVATMAARRFVVEWQRKSHHLHFHLHHFRPALLLDTLSTTTTTSPIAANVRLKPNLS
jgi:hypothetical protein